MDAREEKLTIHLKEGSFQVGNSIKINVEQADDVHIEAKVIVKSLKFSRKNIGERIQVRNLKAPFSSSLEPAFTFTVFLIKRGDW